MMLKDLIVSLFKVDGVKFGSFQLKSGITSPIYFDLRVIVSHPQLLKQIGDLVGEELKRSLEQYDVICGVPYTALPIASLVSVAQNIPMLVKRKEQKKYGTGKLIEGSFTPGMKCLIIEDVVTSGSSVLETAESLRAEGLIVDKCIVILDRGQGASLNLSSGGISITPLITMNNLLSVLLQEGLISPSLKGDVETFLTGNQLFDKASEDFKTLLETFIKAQIRSDLGANLLRLVGKKKSNLCLSVDLDNWQSVLDAAELLGDKICLLKTHIDTMNFKGAGQFQNFQQKLKELAEKHQFMIMEDRKFADIGSTVIKQLTSKPFEISQWADIVTMHGIQGSGPLKAIEGMGPANQNNHRPVGVVLIAEMSSEGNIPSAIPRYKEEIFKIAETFQSTVVGFVSQSKVVAGPQTFGKSDPGYFIQFTPGVSLDPGTKGDGLGQQYCSVREAILNRGADVVIVGRGILQSAKEEWVPRAEEFRKEAWTCFVEKFNKILV